MDSHPTIGNAGTSYKLQGVLYGTTLRLSGKFFVHQDAPAEPQAFVEQHRMYMRELRPMPTSHHTKIHVFQQKALETCTHVFIRTDHARAPLELPYQGPYQVVERSSDRVYKINVDGHKKSISIERLKPADIAQENKNPSPPLHRSAEQQPNNEENQPSPRHISFASVSTQANQDTGEGVDVALQRPALPTGDQQRHLETEPRVSRNARRQRKQALQPRSLF